MVFNVLSMKYNEPQNEAYNRLTLDGMKWSSSKVNAIKASMTEEESFLSYVFPLLRYHSRWSELTGEDFEYMFKGKRSFHQGYLMRVDVRPVTSYPSKKPLPDYQFGATAYEYQVDLNTAGVYPVTYRAEDSAGNVSKVIIRVYVVESETEVDPARWWRPSS